MALEKKLTYDYEIRGKYKTIYQREKMAIMEDGVEISKKYTRKSFVCTSDLSNESNELKSLASGIWTDDIKESYLLSINGYPSGEPSDSWTEAQLQKYLSVNGVAWTEEHTKAQLLTKAKAKFGE